MDGEKERDSRIPDPPRWPGSAGLADWTWEGKDGPCNSDLRVKQNRQPVKKD